MKTRTAGRCALKKGVRHSMTTGVRLWSGMLLSLAVLSALRLEGATYYVDFSAGSDANTGLSATTAWKRAPGDPQATGVAAAKVLVGGDTVLFRGGVTYRGNLVLSRSGAAGSPVTYKGDGWGTSKALMEGSAPYQPVWTRCATAADCQGNPNFSQIYFAPAPAGYSDFRTALYENGEFLWYAQGPNPPDPFYYDDIDDFYVVPFQSTTIKQTTTSVTDPRILTQTSASFWNNAYVAAWINGNVVDIRKVTAFNPTTHTLSHETLSNTPYTDRDGRYSLFNHLSLIDRPGEYVYDPAGGRIYVWPRNGLAPSGNAYETYARGTAFYAGGAVNYVAIEGFRIERFTMGIKIENGGGSNVVVRNNDLRTLRAGDWYAIHMEANNSLVEGNSIVDANRAVGILSGADNVTIRGNHVERTSRQGIWFMGASNSKILNNTVTNITGSHSNGISVYSGSLNILISGNQVIGVNSPITFEDSENLTFTNNIVVGTGSGNNINDWFGSRGTIAFYNNVFPNSSFGAYSSATYVLKNNVLMSAPAGATRSHNIFTKSGMTLKTAEFTQTDLALLFVSPAQNNFRLKTGSPAIDAGTSVPVSNDIEGTLRPQGSAWDIGAFEYLSSGLAAPQITTQPVSQTVTAGQTATFSVAATGNPAPSYQWKFGTATVGTNSPTLNIPNAQPVNAGSYQCVVSNTQGSVTSQTVILTVTVFNKIHHVRIGANGSGSGDDWNNAYPNLPTILIRGDTYYLADGSYGSYTFDDAVSGTALISIRKATAADHGTSTGWVSTYGDGQALFDYVGFTRGFYILDGATGGGPGSWETGFGIKVKGSTHVIEFPAAGVSTVTLRHLDIEGEGRAAAAETDLLYLVNSFSNITVSRCFLHDVSRTMILTWPANGDGFLIEYSKFARNGNAEHREAWSAGPDDNVTVRYNLFEDIMGTGFIAIVNNNGDATNWNIHGNVFYWTGNLTDGIINSGAIVTRFDGAGGPISVRPVNWNIHNNVFYNIRGFTSGIVLANGSNCFAYNNIWCNNQTTSTGISGATGDYNWRFGNTSNATGGAHDLIGTGNPFVNASAMDFRLVAAIPGIVLGALFNTDALGAVRGADGAWDRGAYEFTGGTPPPLKPVITSALTASGFVGAAFGYAITASNGPTGFNASGLPSGLSVNTTTGVISGTPTAAGTSSVTLSATNAAGTGTATLTLTISSSIRIGEPNVLALDDNGNGSLLLAQQASLTQTATLQSLSFYVTNASGKLRLGVYDATGPSGGPGAKKAETNEMTPILGWNTAGVTVPVLLPAGTYWLAYLPSDNALAFKKELTGLSKYYPYAYGVMPSTFSSAPSSEAVHWSLYATFNLSANKPPVSSAQSKTAAEDTPLAITLSASDPDSGPGALTYAIVSPPAHGTLSGAGANRTYTPALNYNGPDGFTFKANDGAADSNIATVSITVTAVNDPPVLGSTPTATPNPAKTGQSVAFFAAASDVEGDVLTYAWTFGDGTSGSGSAPSHVYSAAGIYAPQVTVSDGKGGVATATLSLTVTVPDTTGPVLAVTSVILKGTVSDVSGVASLTVNGVAVTVGAGGIWQKEVTLPNATNSFTIIATDKAGNKASQTLTISK